MRGRLIAGTALIVMGFIAGVVTDAIGGTVGVEVDPRVQLALIGLLGILAVLGASVIGSYTATNAAAQQRAAQADALRENELYSMRLRVIGEVTSSAWTFHNAVRAQMDHRDRYADSQRQPGSMPAVDVTLIDTVSDLAGQLTLLAGLATAEAARGLLNPMRRLYVWTWEDMTAEDRAHPVGLSDHERAGYAAANTELGAARDRFTREARQELGLPPHGELD